MERNFNFTGAGFSKPFVLMGAALLLFIIAVKSVVVIPAGHVGVKDLFGRVDSTPLQAGIHVVNPLLKIIKLSIQTRELTESANVPSKEGLVVNS